MPSYPTHLYYDDEIDLRKLIKTLLKGWNVILGLVVIGGVGAWGYSKLQPIVYEANAKVYIDPFYLPVSLSPVTFLTSESVRAEAADALEISPAELIVPQVAVNQDDNKLLVVTVRSASAQQAASLANTWAEAAAIVVQAEAEAELAEAEAELAEAEAELAEAEAELVFYLEQTGLQAWGWADLAAYTGVGWEPGIGSRFDVQSLPPISANQRLKLMQLMRVQRSAELKASGPIERDVEGALQSTSQDIDDAAFLIQVAETPASPTGVDVLENTALGLAAGGILGMFWVFAAAWLREDPTD